MRPGHAGLGLLVALAALGCAADHRKTAPPPPVAGDPALESLFVDCRGCHTDEVLTQQRLTEAQWTKVLDKMHRWGAPLEEADAQAVAVRLASSYGRSAGPFVPQRLSADAAEALFEPGRDGALGRGDATRGRALYAERCEPCHAPDGRGGPLGLNLVRARVLDRAPDFAAIVRDGSGRMPAFEATDAELADMLAYVRTLP
jgi:Cytochrome C oxidase, cbb3-type, subunit III